MEQLITQTVLGATDGLTDEQGKNYDAPPLTTITRALKTLSLTLTSHYSETNCEVQRNCHGEIMMTLV